MDDAFAHHVWATLRLIDACASLTPEQLETAVPGTYGSILDTVRHLVEADADYLSFLTDGRLPSFDASEMDLPELRTRTESNGAAWSELLSGNLNADSMVLERDVDGFERNATIGLRLAQAVHHGTDHRSQVCTALTTVSVEPPDIDVWEFGIRTGRSVEVPPTA